MTMMSSIVAGRTEFSSALPMDMPLDQPAGVDATLWRLSTPIERQALVEAAKTSPPQSAATDEIIVRGHRPSAGGGTLMYYEVSSVWHEVEVTPDGTVTDTAGVTPPADVAGDPNDKSVGVKVTITNAANHDNAMKAAANVQKGIDAYRSMLAGADQAKVLTINGKTTTVGQELAKLRNTGFTITDKPYTNGGVGKAVAGTDGGPNQVEFNFESFDGQGERDYAHPNYQHNEGMLGIIGHELGHVSESGVGFNRDSDTYWKAENRKANPKIDFPNSIY